MKIKIEELKNLIIKAMSKKYDAKTMRTISLIVKAVEKIKQKTILRIVRKLKEMSANDLSTLDRILGWECKRREG